LSAYTDVRIGGEFLDYRIEEPIGQGGMGVVYLAYDNRLKRKVALKLMAPELAHDERFRERFSRESELAMSLEHPNVIPIHDAGEADGRLYLAMRYVEGTDLRALLREEGSLEPLRALAIVRQIAQALDAAHVKGLVHRDVKPSNVLLDASEHVYLADFGLTRRQSAEVGQPGEARSLGTPAYIAPEQIEGGPIDARADVYSLGCLLYECLTGAPPFGGSSRLEIAWAHLEEEPPSATECTPDLPGGIDDVIRKALAKQRDDRYPTCAALIDAAEAALGFHRPIADRLRRRLVAGTLAAALAVGAAVFLLRGGDAAPPVVPNSLVKIDANTQEVVDVFPVGRGPGMVEIVGRYVFLASEGDGTLTRVDRRTGAVVNSGQYDAGRGIAREGDERLWVASPGRREVVALDVELPALQVEDRSVPEKVPLPPSASAASLAVGGGSLWISTNVQDRAVDRWRLHTLRRERTYPIRPSDHGLDVAFGYGSAWISLGDPADALLRIDARSGRAARVRVGDFPFGSAIGFGSLWVAMASGDEVWRIDPVTGRPQAVIPVGNTPLDVAVGPKAVWLTNECDGTVSRIDPSTNAVVETIDIGYHPYWLAADKDFVWVGVSGVGFDCAQ
jgi:YVTN family beta-propeller protein